jgi:hypothetical protein
MIHRCANQVAGPAVSSLAGSFLASALRGPGAASPQIQARNSGPHTEPLREENNG